MQEEIKPSYSAPSGDASHVTHAFDLTGRVYLAVVSVIIVFTILCLAYLVSVFGNLPVNQPYQITVSAEGKTFAKPDIAQVYLGVHTEAPKSQDAVASNNDAMNKVIAAIKASGVKDEDIQTTSYSLYPNYGYPKVLTPMMMGGISSAPSYIVDEGKRTITGYSLDQQVMVKIRDFNKISEILDKATTNGANTVGSLQFAIDNPEKVQAEARDMAIAKAKEKLENIAKASGLRIGKLLNVSEGYSPYPIAYGMGGGPMMAKDIESSAPQIQTGQQEINVTVTLTYQVK